MATAVAIDNSWLIREVHKSPSPTSVTHKMTPPKRMKRKSCDSSAFLQSTPLVATTTQQYTPEFFHFLQNCANLPAPMPWQTATSATTRSPALPRKKRKRVRFAPSVKHHDGLCADTHMLEEVIYDLFYRKQDRFRTIRGVINAGNIAVLRRLDEQLMDLKNRCAVHRAPVLPGGGGRGYFLTPQYAPWLERMAARIAQFAEFVKINFLRTGVKSKPVVNLGAAFRL